MVEEPKNHSEQVPTPAGEVAEWRQWTHGPIVNGQETGIYEPPRLAGAPRVFHAINPGERVEIERRDGDYEVRVIGPGATRMLRPFSQSGPIPEQKKGVVDSARLNKLMFATEKPGINFGGPGLSLEEEDRAELQKVINLAKQLLERAKQRPDWKEFEARLAQQDKETGNIRVPGMSVISGGPNQKTIEQRVIPGETQVHQLVVPEHIYGTYKLEYDINTVTDVLKQTNENLRGKMTQFLGEAMRNVGTILKQNNVI